MLGAIIGDIVGSVYEWDNYKAKDFQPLFHPRAFFTDDTVCTVAVADALLNGKDPALTLKEWGRRYWDNGGWGGRFAQWLQSEDITPYGSFGNGAAMRVSAAGHIADSVEEAINLSKRVTEVTHNHPEGLRGAAATAVAIHLALHDNSAENIRSEIAWRFGYNLNMTVDEIRPGYCFNETCQGTVPQALLCALEAKNYEDAVRNAISIGGDSDTVAAIAGGVAEALFGLPEQIALKGWGYLPRDIREVVELMYERYPIHLVKF